MNTSLYIGGVIVSLGVMLLTMSIPIGLIVFGCIFVFGGVMENF